MISGDYSRKELKETIMNRFPDIASCQFYTNNSTQNPTIVISVKKVDDFSGGGVKFQKFTDAELAEIFAAAVPYIPEKYRVTIKNIQGQKESSRQFRFPCPLGGSGHDGDPVQKDDGRAPSY